MKKKVWLLIAALLVCAGCDDSATSSGGKTSVIAGVWDFTLIQSAAPDKQYIVTVELGGGSGVALVSITGPMVSDTATVIAGLPVNLGVCGTFMIFGNIGGFNLATGDSWTVPVSNGLPRQPVPEGVPASITGLIIAGGLDACGQATCNGSSLGSAVPPINTGAAVNPPGVQWLSVRINQSSASMDANVPEQHVLSLNLGAVPLALLPPLINQGDTVTITFRREVNADGNFGDMFRAFAANGAQSPDADYLWGTSVQAADTAISLTFTAAAPLVRIEFVGGLSSPGENIKIDDVQVSTAAAGVVMSENFETGPGPDCGPSGANAARWEVRASDWPVGSLCVSANGALDGTYSARWDGGSYHRVSGSILAGSVSSSLDSLLGGGGGAAFLSALAGVFMEAWEPVWTGFFTSFTAAQEHGDAMIGNFKGESRTHDCIETGQVIATIHKENQTDFSQYYWAMRIDGEAINCQPAPIAGATIVIGDTLTTLVGDTVNVLQVSQIFFGAGPVFDDYLNSYALGGTAAGSMINLSLVHTGGNAAAAGVGFVSGNQIEGTLTGTMVFDAGRVCELTSDTAFTVDLIAK